MTFLGILIRMVHRCRRLRQAPLIWTIDSYSTLLPRGINAITIGCVIIVRARERWNEGLLAHEKVHVDQWFDAYGLLFWFRYLTSPVWRLYYEIEAYREQLKYRPDQLDMYAKLLAENYYLRNLTPEKARELLLLESINEEEG